MGPAIRLQPAVDLLRPLARDRSWRTRQPNFAHRMVEQISAGTIPNLSAQQCIISIIQAEYGLEKAQEIQALFDTLNHT